MITTTCITNNQRRADFSFSPQKQNLPSSGPCLLRKRGFQTPPVLRRTLASVWLAPLRIERFQPTNKRQATSHPLRREPSHVHARVGERSCFLAPTAGCSCAGKAGGGVKNEPVVAGEPRSCNVERRPRFVA